MKPNLGIGIDAVDLASFKRRMQDNFIDRILSEKERAVYDALNHPQRKLEYAAGRFAVKEAYVKAVKKVGKGLNFKDISVLNDTNGAPYLLVPSQSASIIDISITHTEYTVIAIVLMDKEA